MNNHLARSHHINYRPDIDGLRAIAVLAVVFFHALPLKFPGGFIGVDIFFVISGFLISSIIIKNLDSGTFSFIDFYKRRIKRIFPVLLLIMFFSIIIGFLLQTSDEYNQLGKHIISGLGFFSNFTLWNESGYFDVDATTKPLLHLWSLGVEEQFYIIWPLLIFSLWKSKINIFFSIVILTIASFYINVHYINEFPVFAFYLPLTRFWEFLCGCMLAWLNFSCTKNKLGQNQSYFYGFINTYINGKYKKYCANIASLVGITLLIIAFAVLNKDAVFPGYWALLPTLAATFIIAGKDSFFNKKILSNKVMVWFGLISFSLYLWHWPLLSFGEIFYRKIPRIGYRITVIFVSIGLAWLTYKYIENPIRHSKSTTRFIKLIGTYFLCLCIGIFIYKYDFSESQIFKTLTVQKKGTEFAYGPSLKYYRGKDHWLFIGNIFNHNVEKLKMAIHPSKEDINKTHQLFSDIAETAKQYNTQVVYILGPEKTTIYSEYLPDALIPAPARYIDAFLDDLRTIDNLTVYDPTADLREAKKTQGLLYFRTDTHWNYKGAYIAYAGLMKALNTPAIEVHFQPGPIISGDTVTLSQIKHFPLRLGDNWIPVFRQQQSWSTTAVEKSKSTAFGPHSTTVNRSPLSDKYVWVAGDSFSGVLRPYLSATFKEIFYAGHWDDQLKLLPEELKQAKRKPDIVIIERIERSF